MSQPVHYEIQVEGNIPEVWSEYFSGMEIQNEAGGQTLLIGPLPDQSALMSVLSKIVSFNICLISVRRITGSE